MHGSWTQGGSHALTGRIYGHAVLCQLCERAERDGVVRDGGSDQGRVVCGL